MASEPTRQTFARPYLSAAQPAGSAEASAASPVSAVAMPTRLLVCHTSLMNATPIVPVQMLSARPQHAAMMRLSTTLCDKCSLMAF